jgi:hypothetical protein
MRKQIFCLVALLFFFDAKAPAQQAAHATQVIIAVSGNRPMTSGGSKT